MYVHQALESQRIAVLAYVDTLGCLPGDDDHMVVIDGKKVVGNMDGKIDPATGESAKVFRDMALALIIPRSDVRIRGIELELLWMRFMSGGNLLMQGNFFRLKGLNRLEALAVDRKFDDGDPQGGDILSFGDSETVDFYSKLDLYR